VTEGVRFLHVPTTLAIWNDSGARGTDLLVLLTVGTFMPASDRSCRPSIGALASRSGLHEETIRVSLARLQQSGVLDIQRRDRMPSVLTLRLATTPEIPSTDLGSTPETPTREIGRNYPGNTGQTTPEIPTRNKEEVKKRGRAAPLSDDFSMNDDMKKWASEKCPEVDVEYATQRFVNYYVGEGKSRVEWVPIWQNWILADQKRLGARVQEIAEVENVTQLREKRELAESKAKWCADHYVSVPEFDRRFREPGFLAELEQRVADHVPIWGEARRAARARRAVA
jgi:hypothetical protein